MFVDPLVARARRGWLELAGVPVAFPVGDVVRVVISAGSLLCPSGWVGIVSLGDAAIATVPVDDLAEVVQAACAVLPVAALTDPDQLRRIMPVADVLGPAILAYCDEHAFQPIEPDATEMIPGDHSDLAALLASVSENDAKECGLAEITSSAFVIRNRTQIVAAAGYSRWPAQVAHMCVLTAPEQRGRGLARVVASAAVAHGLANQMVPQWQARPEPSRRVARALGFRELGTQLSIRIEDHAD